VALRSRCHSEFDEGSGQEQPEEPGSNEEVILGYLLEDHGTLSPFSVAG
jgi:hypothetical protein